MEKINYTILNIKYNYSDFEGDYVAITTQLGSKTNIIKISYELAVSSGFINPNALKQYNI